MTQLATQLPSLEHPAVPPRGALETTPEVMALRYYGDPALQTKCEPVVYTPAYKALAANMLLTMIKRKGLGIAGPQVGVLQRIFVVDVEWPERGGEGLGDSNSYVFINPAIVSRSAETVQSVEGCLSFPGDIQIEVTRAKAIVVHALDINGDPFTLEADGILSVVIQHEFDHIEGHTFVDKKGFATRSFARKTVTKR